MKNKKLIIVLFTMLTTLMFVGCSDKAKIGKDAVNEYKNGLASDYEKKGNSYLAKGRVEEASVYFDLAKDEGAKENPLQDSLSQWLKARDLEQAGKYEQALNALKGVKKSSSDKFNEILDRKVAELTKIISNSKRYEQVYQEANMNYQNKAYTATIEKLRVILEDPEIKNKEYIEVFSSINSLLLTATIDQANLNLAGASQGQQAPQVDQQQQQSQTQVQSNAQQSQPPKLANGKKVTDEDITKARQQIDVLNVNGMKSNVYSGEDVKAILDISIKNKHDKITKSDIEEFLKKKK